MATEGVEWEWVADAAAPDTPDTPDTPAPHAVRTVGASLRSRAGDPDALATPEDAARLVLAARGAARLHLDRHARRVRKGKGPAGEWAEARLDDVRVCAIDLETTGGSGDDAIVEIGCVQSDRTSWGREFVSLVRPARPMTRAAARVHGIDPAALATAPGLASMLPYVEELSARRVLLAHNAGFDVGFLERAIRDAGRAPLARIVADSVPLARTLLGGRCGLGAAARRLGIDAPHVHRALPDARLATLLWWALVEIVAQEGASTLGEIPGVRPPQPLLHLAAPACHTCRHRVE